MGDATTPAASSAGDAATPKALGSYEVAQAAVEKVANVLRTGPKSAILRMLRTAPYPLSAIKASWVTVTKRRVVIRLPLPLVKGESKIVLDRHATTATLLRLWKKHGTNLVAHLTGMSMTEAAVEAVRRQP